MIFFFFFTSWVTAISYVVCVYESVDNFLSSSPAVWLPVYSPIPRCECMCVCWCIYNNTHACTVICEHLWSWSLNTCQIANGYNVWAAFCFFSPTIARCSCVSVCVRVWLTQLLFSAEIYSNNKKKGPSVFMCEKERSPKN